MYYNFACPSCGKNLKASEENEGKKARCPYCKASVTVPPSPFSSETPSGEPAATGGVKAPAVPALNLAAPSNRVRPPARKGKTRKSRPGENTDSTRVDMTFTAVCGVGGTILFYLMLAPLPDIYLRQLFFERGWVTVAEAFLMFWSIAILVFKARKLLKQRESMLLDVLPESLAKEITIAEVDQFAGHVRDLPIDPGFSFLTRRVLRGLEHFRVRRSASEVATVLASQSEIDAHAVNSSYAILNVFIWAIPILGFIGTVQGLGSAVGSLGVQDAANVDAIKDSLGTITGGLGVAFDTTLVALVISLMLKFPASSLQKSEEDLLNWVDEYCNENLLKRLKEDPADTSPTDSITRRVQAAIDASMAAHHAELRTWTKKLSEIGGTVTGEVVKGWSSIQQDLQQQHAQRVSQLHDAVSGISRSAEQLAATATQMAELQQAQAQLMADSAAAIDAAVRQVDQRAQEHLGQIETNLRLAVEQMGRSLEQLATETQAAHQLIAQSTQQSAGAAERWLAGVQEGVQGLNSVLASLGERQVVIQTEAKSRSGWGLFGRRNNRR
jgi:biopolymer transport protein ExbB/TolQ/DNA-directed RNA polymerase subunit RPC12/RpoP